ncbi:MAG: hypothetical protein PHU94_02365 [Bacilli bacterium]|nr:hypothetical protein [Bacilli bacterium]MDD4733744.1 hypothetical protein [Bacilli bacterium]
MIIRYNDYENIIPEIELEKILSSDKIELVLEPKNKKCLFLLGIMFAAGKPITILNEETLNLNETTKSFSIMPYVWSKIADDNFPSKDFSNVKTEMDKRIENIKRLGVTLAPIENNPIENKIFLICPVRNASLETIRWIEDFVFDKESHNIIIHAPHLHTVQTDMFGGYTICLQNEKALASSSEIDLYYDQSSTGSVFDLGAAYYFKKPLILLNKEEIEFVENDFIDNIINNWPYKKQTKSLILKK